MIRTTALILATGAAVLGAYALGSSGGSSAPASPSPARSATPTALRPALPACVTALQPSLIPQLDPSGPACLDSAGGIVVLGVWRCADGRNLVASSPAAGVPQGWYLVGGPFNPGEPATDPGYRAAYEACGV